MTARTRVKICGLTRLTDAELAVELGADAIGFVFWSRSPRAVRPADVRQIVDQLPPFVTRVGVFVDASPAQVVSIAREAGLDVAQLHGDEPLEPYRSLDVRIMRVAKISSDDDARVVASWPRAIMPIVDAVDHERRGGTGTVANWTAAARLAAERPMVLAGGLTPVNVADAMAQVRPWAVDVSSGVEESPGIKSAERMRAFFAAVRAGRLEDR